MKILFVDGTQGFDENRIKKRPTGGILNSLIIIPKYLADKGHEVSVVCTCKKKHKANGVTYLPVDYSDSIPKWDVAVFNRNAPTDRLVGYSKKIGAKVVWWLHDIVDFRYLSDGSYKHVDKIIALSEYCKTSYSQFYDIPEGKFVVIPNGVDKSIFYPGEYGKRKKHKMIMASALIKGYLPVEQTWNSVNRLFPSAELYIYSSQTLHNEKDSPEQSSFLQGMERMGATILKPVTQDILAEIMRGSWLFLMPNSYPEICSNLLLQARACGLPVVSSKIGANPEFIQNDKTGIITDFCPHDIWLWVKKYAEATVKICQDDDRHQMISENASTGILDWNEIGEIWSKELEALCSKK